MFKQPYRMQCYLLLGLLYLYVSYSKLTYFQVVNIENDVNNFENFENNQLKIKNIKHFLKTNDIFFKCPLL